MELENEDFRTELIDEVEGLYCDGDEGLADDDGEGWE